MKYEKRKRSKVGRCNICGETKPLTWDHVPPKAALIEPDTYANTLFSSEELPSPKRYMMHFQSGIKYRTVCADCNNVLIGRNDDAYKEFLNLMVKGLKHAALSAEQGLLIPPRITVPTRINRVLRAVCGHILAMKSDYDDTSIIDKHLRAYLMDESLKFDHLQAYCWFYPYPTIVNARDFSVRSYREGTHPTGLISVMSAYPLAFMISTEDETSCQLDDLGRYTTTCIDDDVTIAYHFSTATYAHTNDLKHFVWPADISDDKSGAMFALGSDAFMEGSRIGVTAAGPFPARD